MKRKTMVSLITIVAVVAVAMSAGCNGNGRDGGNGGGGDGGYIPQTPTPTSPKPTSQADLQIVDVRVEKGDQPGFTHVVVATVRNNGEGSASGFDGGCEWNCPWGQPPSAGADIVQGGYIPGNSQFTYKQPLTVHCEGSPTTLYFVCTIDNHNDVKETNENNNQWSGQVNIPW